MIRRLRPLLLSLTTVVVFASPALAGPPLLCFPFEIGEAKSLPIGTGGWHAIDPRYDTARLVDDTLALLTTDTPIVVRMETIRRATLYAAKDRALAAALLDRLQQRAARPGAGAPLAVFDFGYLAETFKQASWALHTTIDGVQHIDGYNLVAKAAALREDPAIEFALAVMTRDKTRGDAVYRAHLAKVLKAAPENPSIAANLRTQDLR